MDAGCKVSDCCIQILFACSVCLSLSIQKRQNLLIFCCYDGCVQSVCQRKEELHEVLSSVSVQISVAVCRSTALNDLTDGFCIVYKVRIQCIDRYHAFCITCDIFHDQSCKLCVRTLCCSCKSCTAPVALLRCRNEDGVVFPCVA